MTIQLFWNPQSRATNIRWLLEELGVDYELVTVEFSETGVSVPDLLTISPLGKIPAIRDGDVSVSDTAAIAIYLADKYKDGADLAPAFDDPGRGEYLRWLVFQATSIDPAMLQAGLKFDTPPAQTGWGSADRVIDAVDRRLDTASPYLLGDRFTAADVVVGGALALACYFGLFPRRPAFTRYIEQVTSRPAFQRAMASNQSR